MRNPQINMTAPVNASSQVKRIGIDNASGTIVIDFPFGTYHYKGAGFVPYEEIRTAASAGHALAVILKADPVKYPAHKVVAGQECDCFEINAGEVQDTTEADGPNQIANPDFQHTVDEDPVDRADREQREADNFGIEGLPDYNS
jgi:hypothetical protein